MDEQKLQMIQENQPSARSEKYVSDAVMIEIVHAFKDIIIEFIGKRYNMTK